MKNEPTLAVFVRFYAPDGENIEKDAVLQIARHVEKSIRGLTWYFRVFLGIYLRFIETAAWILHFSGFSRLHVVRQRAFLADVFPRFPVSALVSKLLSALILMGYFDLFEADGTRRDGNG